MNSFVYLTSGFPKLGIHRLSTIRVHIEKLDNFSCAFVPNSFQVPQMYSFFYLPIVIKLFLLIVCFIPTLIFVQHTILSINCAVLRQTTAYQYGCVQIV